MGLNTNTIVAIRWYLLSAVVFAMDQLSKYWIVQYTLPWQPLKVFDFFNFTLAHNRGAAFSFLGEASGWQVVVFCLIAIVIIIGIAVSLWQIPQQKKLLPFGLALILGGACGNLCDRLRFGYVIDFLDFHLGAWHYAFFNVADSAICIGAFLLLLNWWRESSLTRGK